MGIIAWLRKRRLEKRKREQAQRLSEIRTGLKKFKPRDIRMRFAIEAQLVRVGELRKQLNKVKSEKELRFWHSLFDMCAPSFRALLSASPTSTKTRRLKKGSKK